MDVGINLPPGSAGLSSVNPLITSSTGAFTVGSVLTCSAGGIANPNFQWVYNNLNTGALTPIPGALNSSSYTIASADQGSSIDCLVTPGAVPGSVPASPISLLTGALALTLA